MVDVLKILVLLQQNARGPRQNKYNSNESSFANCSEEDEIYPLTGVVHAYVDQKLLKSNKIKSFNR